jgi:hypothetical protein
MKSPVRHLLFFVFIGLVLLAGLVFRQFVLAAVLLPAATAVWLLLRIFVLSIHQQVIWWGAIVAAVVAAFGGLVARPAALLRTPAADPAPVRDRVSAWRDSIRLHLLTGGGRDRFRQELMWLFTSLYLSRGQGKAKYQVRDDILEHRIPIAESIYTYLFLSPEPAPKRPFLTHPVQRLRMVSESFTRGIQEWVSRRTGRAAADRLRAVDVILSVMEKSLEMRKENDAPEVPPVS